MIVNRRLTQTLYTWYIYSKNYSKIKVQLFNLTLLLQYLFFGTEPQSLNTYHQIGPHISRDTCHISRDTCHVTQVYTFRPSSSAAVIRAGLSVTGDVGACFRELLVGTLVLGRSTRSTGLPSNTSCRSRELAFKYLPELRKYEEKNSGLDNKPQEVQPPPYFHCYYCSRWYCSVSCCSSRSGTSSSPSSS